jgi:hypothetical protein
MTSSNTARRVISVTMTPDLHDRLIRYCKDQDLPITVVVRDALKRILPPPP